jgi:flagellar biosynthesis/type III secretory pathway chaperone
MKMQAKGLTDLTQQLIEILGHEITIGRTLLAAVQAEKSALIESNAQAFSIASFQKEEQAKSLTAAECRRLAISAQMAGILGISPEGVRLADLIKHSDGSTARSLSHCKTELQRLMGRLQQENQENKTLLNHCCDLVSASLTMLRNLIFPKPTYVRSGQIQGITEGGMLISNKI